MSPELLILAALNVYRLTLLISKEEGPGDIFGKLRTLAGVKTDQYSNDYGTNWISRGMLCPYCLSVWIGLFVALALWAAVHFGYSELVFYLLLPLGLSGAAVFMYKWAGT